MKQYVCVRKCHFGKGGTVNGKAPPRKIYLPGDLETFEEGEYVPRHFVPVDKLPPPEPLKPEDVRIHGLRAPVDPDELAKIKAGKKETKKEQQAAKKKTTDDF